MIRHKCDDTERKQIAFLSSVTISGDTGLDEGQPKKGFEHSFHVHAELIFNDACEAPRILIVVASWIGMQVMAERLSLL